jgi:hypothetical protein
MIQACKQLIGLIVIAATLAAAPTSNPSTKPAVNDPRLRSFTSEEMGFRFKAPKIWKLIADDTPKGEFKLELPAPKPANGGMISTTGVDIIGAVCQGKPDLQEQVKAARAHELSMNEFSLVSEGPTTLGSHEAYAMVFDIKTSFTLPNGKNIVHITRDQVILAVENGKLYSVYFDTDDKSFPTKVKLLKPVLDSFEFISADPVPANSDKPAS